MRGGPASQTSSDHGPVAPRGGVEETDGGEAGGEEGQGVDEKARGKAGRRCGSSRKGHCE